METAQHGGETRCLMCNSKYKGFRDKESESSYCPVCMFPNRIGVAVALNDDNFQKYVDICIARMVVAFWAPYDSICITFMPQFHEAARHHVGSAILITVDVAQNPELKRYHNIQVLPTIVVMEYGKEINRVLGTTTRYELERLLEGGSI
jgi:thioredoxin 2